MSSNPALTHLLRSRLSPKFYAVAVGVDVTTIRETVQARRPHLTLLDAAMREGAVAATTFITSRNAGRVVLFSTAAAPLANLYPSLRAGASGYLINVETIERLPEIVSGVLRGEAALPRNAVADLLAEFRARPDSVIDLPNQRQVHLTQRERDVLQMMHTGMTTKQIARRLGIEAVTIRSHVATLKRKTHVSNRAELLSLQVPSLGALAPHRT